MTVPDGKNASTMTRAELYERVWSTAVSKLATEFGLSDVGLAKSCKRHDIPRPSLGYWAKREVGKAPPRPPLPAVTDPRLETISLPRPQTAEAPPVPVALPASADDEIARMLVRAQGLVFHPAGPSGKLHPGAERTLRALEMATKSKHSGEKGVFSTSWEDRPQCFSVYVGPESFGRAVGVLDQTLRACDEMGMTFKAVEDRERRGQELVFLGERFTFSIREKVKRRPHVPKPGERTSWIRYEYDPAGVLEMRLLAVGYSGRGERSWCDRQRAKIEDMLGEVFVEMVLVVDGLRRHRAAEKQREIERREAARVAEEERRTRQDDLAAARDLLDQTERWHAAESVRRYAAAVRLHMEAKGPIAAGSEADDWLVWADRTADRLDPLTANKGTALKVEDLYPVAAPTWNSYPVADVRRGRPLWLGGWPNVRHQ